MASRLMHYCIANEILKEITLNRELFVLGNLAPDAHDGTKRGNTCSHFRRKVDDKYGEFPDIDLTRFKMKYISDQTDAFAVGYYCHLIADDAWAKAMFPKYLQYKSDDENAKQRKLCFHDFTVLNTILPERLNLSFKNDLTIPAKFSIEEFTHERLKPLLNALYVDFTYENNDVIELNIFNIEFILEYLHDSVKRCVGELRLIELAG